MFDWPGLLCTTAPLPDDRRLAHWITGIARQLLLGTRLRAAGNRYRPVEIEFYYHWSGHPDPFSHRDPVTLECGRWYFHRSHGTYRAGSFKGVDVTFGDGGSFAGILIRGMETSDGTLIDGPSLLVDHLLAVTVQPDMATLDAVIGTRKVWDSKSPLSLEVVPMEERPILQTARVGLTLKHAGRSPDRPNFILRPYRFLTEPKRTAKGKPQMVLALYQQGLDVEDIAQRTRCPRKAIQRYIADFEAGKSENFESYFGKDLTPGLLCRLHGTWAKHYGTGKDRP